MSADAREMTPEVQAILARARAHALSNPNAFFSDRERERLANDTDIEAAIDAKLRVLEQRLAKAFERFDVDGDGVVTVEEIQSILGLERSDAEAFVAQFDRDGDACVDYQEFLLASLAQHGLVVLSADDREPE